MVHLHTITYQYHYRPLYTSHYIALQYNALQHTTLHHNTLQHITIHFSVLHYISLHYTTIVTIVCHQCSNTFARFERTSPLIFARASTRAVILSRVCAPLQDHLGCPGSTSTCTALDSGPKSGEQLLARGLEQARTCSLLLILIGANCSGLQPLSPSG